MWCSNEPGYRGARTWLALQVALEQERRRVVELEAHVHRTSLGMTRSDRASTLTPASTDTSLPSLIPHTPATVAGARLQTPMSPSSSAALDTFNGGSQSLSAEAHDQQLLSRRESTYHVPSVKSRPKLRPRQSMPEKCGNESGRLRVKQSQKPPRSSSSSHPSTPKPSHMTPPCKRYVYTPELASGRRQGADALATYAQLSPVAPKPLPSGRRRCCLKEGKTVRELGRELIRKQQELRESSAPGGNGHWPSSTSFGQVGVPPDSWDVPSGLRGILEEYTRLAEDVKHLTGAASRVGGSLLRTARTSESIAAGSGLSSPVGAGLCETSWSPPTTSSGEGHTSHQGHTLGTSVQSPCASFSSKRVHSGCAGQPAGLHLDGKHAGLHLDGKHAGLHLDGKHAGLHPDGKPFGLSSVLECKPSKHLPPVPSRPRQAKGHPLASKSMDATFGLRSVLHGAGSLGAGCLAPQPAGPGGSGSFDAGSWIYIMGSSTSSMAAKKLAKPRLEGARKSLP
jgi:hypothetical protein